MELTMFSDFDFVSELFSQPWVSPNDKTAIRAYGFAVNDPACHISQFANDHALFAIGIFNDSTAEIKPFPPRLVARAGDLAASRGAAVGGEPPLKPQSDPNGVNADDAE